MDLISNLPDELLLRIISLLSTKEAISTSVLSKKWEKVWVNLKRLHFHIESGSNLHVDQIDRILNRLQSFGISIYLDCSQKLSPGVVAKWIDDSVRLNPREIEIHVIYMEIPSTLFSCVNLTHLNLHSSLSSSITVPEDFCLPNVKSIVFMVSCPPKQLTEKIFRSCPELEKLKLGGIRNFIGQDYHKDLVYDISCPSLKFLDIRFWGRVTNATDPIIFLNAPNLESVEIADKFGLQFVVQGSCAPLKATIGLTSCCYDFEPEEDISRAYTLLKWMSAVKSLSMDECMTYALDIFPLNSVPPLLNLTRLYLNIPRLTDWTLFFNILENTPNLQSLTIEKECAHSDECSYPQYPPQDFDWTEPRSPATCLVSHLEEISIIGFYGMKCDLMAMKYLLANANVLNEFKASPRRLGFKKEDIFWMMLEGYAKNFTCRYVVLVPDE